MTKQRSNLFFGNHRNSNKLGNMTEQQEGAVRKYVVIDFNLKNQQDTAEDNRSSSISGNFRNVLEKFLGNPPREATADSTTELRLDGFHQIFFVESRRLRKTIGVPLLAWKRFVAFWFTKLESLEVDYFDNFLNPRRSYLNLMLGSPFLERLHVYKIEQEFDMMNQSREVFLELPQRIFELEHLTIDCLRLSSPLKREFFNRLSRNDSLKTFNLKSILLCDLDYLVEFIEKTQRLGDLEVTLTMNCSGWTDLINAKDEYLDFAHAVAMSRYPIWLRQFIGKGLRNEVDLEEILKGLNKRSDGIFEFDITVPFRKSIEWITVFWTSSPIDSELMKFNYLKRLDSLRLWTTNDRPVVLVNFPADLKTLGVEKVLGKFPAGKLRSLVHLNFIDYQSSLMDLVKFLSVLDTRFPLLKTFGIKWNCTDEDVEDSSVAKAMADINENKVTERQTLFSVPNLESLSFIVSSEGSVKGLRGILMEVFELPKMKLKSLDIDIMLTKSQLQPPLSKDVLNQIISGNLAKSLLRLNIGRGLLEDDAMPAFNQLKALVAGNVRREIERTGSPKIRRDWFDPATWHLDDEEDLTKMCTTYALKLKGKTEKGKKETENIVKQEVMECEEPIPGVK